MSIPQVLNFEQPYLAKVFGANDGYWRYDDKDGNFICYTVRKLGKDGKKYFQPWTCQNNQLKNAWLKDTAGNSLPRPIYRIQELTLHSEKPVLIVEGEKTADSAAGYFQDYVVLSWMGGSGTAKKVDWSCLSGRKVYLLPDNDDAGYKAMGAIKSAIRKIAANVWLIDIATVGVPKCWDVADIPDGHIDLQDIKNLIADVVHIPEVLDRDSFPDLSRKGGILNTAANVKYLLKFYKYEIRYNCVTHRPEFNCDNGKRYSKENELECHYAAICELCVRHCVPKVDLHMWIMYIADECRYNPALDFIESRPWDGVSRINDFINTITADNQELAGVLIYRWMVGAIAAACCEDGVALPGVLVLQGAQGIGKTAWFKALLPTNVHYLAKDGLTLEPNNKDSLISCTSVWLGELGELDATFSRSAISYLKSFITKSVDYVRSPYGRTERQIPRRTAFFGSVNHSNYLVDDTGNRRWWTVAVKEINWQHGLDMQQVWAEFKFLYDAGAEFVPTYEELCQINEENEKFETMDPMEEQIIARFAWQESTRPLAITAAEVLIRLGYSLEPHHAKKTARNCGAILSKLSGTKSRKSNGKMVFDLPRDLMVTPIYQGMQGMSQGM